MVTEYAYAGNLIRVGDGVFELFARYVVGSVRVPIAWAAAGLEPQKHDMIKVEIGTANDPAAPFFARPAFSNGAFIFQIPAAEEPRLREFLEQAASSAGRAT